MVVSWASTTPTTAAETEVPSERIRLLKLFAEAVSESGTALMISAGIAPYARPTPALQISVTTSTPQVDPISSIDSPYPVEIANAPATRVNLGPRAAESRPPSGETTIIIRPDGAIHSPIASID